MARRLFAVGVIAALLVSQGCGPTGTSPATTQVAANPVPESSPPPPPPSRAGDGGAVPAPSPSIESPVAPPSIAPAPAPAAVAAVPPADGDHAAAIATFSAQCQRCHKVEGLADAGPGPGGPPGGPFGGGPPPGGPPGGGRPGGPGGMMRGPDLTHVGAKPDRTVDWIADHIRNPKSHNPRSRMPAFESRMSAEDIQSVAEYLASLK